jgi:hypothetical protein
MLERQWGVEMHRDTKLFIVAGLLVTAGLGLVASPFASSAPDGLERVAADKDFIDSAEDHALADSPVADYSVRGVDNERAGTGIAALIGVLITFGVGLAVFTAIRRHRPDAGPRPDAPL